MIILLDVFNASIVPRILDTAPHATSRGNITTINSE
tara:strand:+ start:604 stop:711 length:108 start_codon:yes stop_codon:yes gene_type:complete